MNLGAIKRLIPPSPVAGAVVTARGGHQMRPLRSSTGLLAFLAVLTNLHCVHRGDVKWSCFASGSGHARTPRFIRSTADTERLLVRCL